MSRWEELQLEPVVLEILRMAHWTDETTRTHGYYYVTSYDLAIELERRDPLIVEKVGYPFGGKGSGKPNTFVQMLGTELSRAIESGHLLNVEKAFLYSNLLKKMEYKRGQKTVESSVVGRKDIGLALFRYTGQ